MIRVRQVKVSIEKDNFEEIKVRTVNKLKIKYSDLKDLVIIKKSIDARDKNKVLFIYEVNVSLENEDKILKKILTKDVEKVKEERYMIPSCGKEELRNRPIVVGAGPCGLFCTLILAEAGFKPILLERGERIEDRQNSVELFWRRGKLNPNSNVCFGEGGAGTFSDGKLSTLVSDSDNRIKKMKDTFIECGAPIEISYENKPHIGTNVLRDVIINLRNKILKLGGEIRYYSTLTDIKLKNGRINKIIVNNEKKLDCDVLVLALGHSARDTIKMLYEKELKMHSKAFAIGVRVQHKQDLINENQYGKYKAKDGRGVYTFCMCPGGYVVNSSCEEGHLIVNGMSNHERDSENANSAVVVTVSEKDFGKNPLDGIEFQRRLESLAFRKGNGKIPVQLWKDYKNNKTGNKYGTIKPIFKGKTSFANLNEIFPYYINDALKEGIMAFDKKIKGFANDDVILAGIESRTSSAVRMERNDDLVSNIDGIYPAGEGAGYSGGITTSAVDGIKVAEKIIEKYSNKSL